MTVSGTGGAALAALAALAAAASGPACSSSRAAPAIVSAEPARAFTGAPIILRITIDNLRPALRIDVSSRTLVADLDSVRLWLVPDPSFEGDKDTALETVDWDGDRRFWAEAPGGLGARSYAVKVTTPWGDEAVVSHAFEALGPDPAPPVLSLIPALTADSIVGEGSVTSGLVVADDGPGGVVSVHWESASGAVGDCPAPDAASSSLSSSASSHVRRDPPPPHLECPFSFTAPRLLAQDPGLQPFGFTAWAIDAADNRAALDVPLRIARLPEIASFAGTVGALGGYQPFQVQGRNFLPGSQVLLDSVPLQGAQLGGDWVSAQVIAGWTPPRNRAGAVLVQVTSAIGTVSASSYFSYVAPPSPREVQPNRGPRSGGSRITVRGNDLRDKAIVYIGTSRATRLPLAYPQYDKAENKIVGCLPPGNGTVSLWVYDPVTGDGELPSSFTYEDSVGGSPPAQDPACR